MSFRIEEKIKLTKYEQSLLMNDLISRGMKVIHPQRRVRSIYFENLQRDIFFHAEEGILPRKKIRIRNYPDESKKNNYLEIKISSIEGRYKTTEKISESKKSIILNRGYLDSNYGLTLPLIIIEYHRNYFYIDGLRITLDSNIKYRSLDGKKSSVDRHCVLEIKAAKNFSTDDLYRIISHPKTRFSKYCNGVNLLGFDRGWVF